MTRPGSEGGLVGRGCELPEGSLHLEARWRWSPGRSRSGRRCVLSEAPSPETDLAALEHVGELPPHHRAQDAAPPVGREDAHPGEAAHGEGPTSGHRQLEGIDGGGADQSASVERSQGAFERKGALERGIILVGVLLAEGDAGDIEYGRPLLFGDPPYLDAAHHTLQGQQRAGRPVDGDTALSGHDRRAREKEQGASIAALLARPRTLYRRPACPDSRGFMSGAS